MRDRNAGECVRLTGGNGCVGGARLRQRGLSVAADKGVQVRVCFGTAQKVLRQFNRRELFAVQLCAQFADG